MDEKSATGQAPLRSTTSDANDDPDSGQVMGPHGESPEDPAARGLYQGCLVMVLVVGLVVAIAVLLYRFFLVV